MGLCREGFGDGVRLFKRKKQKKVKIYFQGGPLDNTEKMIYPNGVHLHAVGDRVAVYHNEGFNVYTFSYWGQK